jgi:uncharacterized membrane protein YeaQ/YmgE (transglycosylase-associated protein family)
MSWIWTLVIGGLAGWIAGKIMKGSGYGLLVDILLGIVGGWLGGFLFGLIGIGTYNIIGELVVSIVGAVVLIWLIHAIRRA